MAPLVSHPRVGYVHGDVGELTVRLQGLDPRLTLVVATKQHPRRPELLGRRYEVWRHNEDGSDLMVGHWRMDEYDRIESDLLVMRAGAEGRTPDAITRIDAHNAEVEDKVSREIQDTLGTMLDHASRLFHDLTQPKNVFRQVGGVGREDSDAPQS